MKTILCLMMVCLLSGIALAEDIALKVEEVDYDGKGTPAWKVYFNNGSNFLIFSSLDEMERVLKTDDHDDADDVKKVKEVMRTQLAQKEVTEVVTEMKDVKEFTYSDAKPVIQEKAIDVA